jgi:hypothetical protein
LPPSPDPDWEEEKDENGLDWAMLFRNLILLLVVSGVVSLLVFSVAVVLTRGQILWIFPWSW